MKVLDLFSRSEQGGGLIEYALIVALIVIAAIAAMTTVGTKISTDFTNIANSL